MDTFVIIFEPHIEGEPRLSLAQQTNELVGPFVNEAAAQEWIDWFENEDSGGVPKPSFQFYILRAITPGEVFRSRDELQH